MQQHGNARATHSCVNTFLGGLLQTENVDSDVSGGVSGTLICMSLVLAAISNVCTRALYAFLITHEYTRLLAVIHLFDDVNSNDNYNDDCVNFNPEKHR